MRHATDLQELDLTGASLGVFPACILEHYSLRKLKLGGCNAICMIPESIGLLSSLEVLDLSETSIYSVPISVGNLSSLKKIELNRCWNLHSLPDSLGTIASLRHIALCRTRINPLPVFMKMHWKEDAYGNGIWERDIRTTQVTKKITKYYPYYGVLAIAGFICFFMVWLACQIFHTK